MEDQKCLECGTIGSVEHDTDAEIIYCIECRTVEPRTEEVSV